MDLQLTGKRALITGSTAGIGLAIASALSSEGAHVLITGRTQPRVDQALEAIRHARENAQCEGLAVDLGTGEGTRLTIERWPDVDILVNNLGIFEPRPFDEISDQDWFRFFEVNVLSGVRLSRHYLPRMKQKIGDVSCLSRANPAYKYPKE